MNAPSEPFTIEPPRREERSLVIDLLVSQRPEYERQAHRNELEKRFADAHLPNGGLFVARRGNKVVGTAWGQELPGRCAVFWPPSTIADEPESTADGLSAHVLDYLRSQNICLAQALLETDQGLPAQRLRRAGFRYITDLLYLVSGRDRFPTEQPATPLCFEPWNEQRHAYRMAQIVEATYEQTLDCPEFNGLRDIADVLDGYRAIGQSGCRQWLIVRHAGQDVGCLLLADHPDHDQWELVYMGLRSEARGRGWGIDMVRYAQWLAFCAGRKRLVLAVDVNNHPAKRMYAEAGFSSWDQRAIFIRSI